jgi:glutamate-1-semialdehyde aminotransferase
MSWFRGLYDHGPVFAVEGYGAHFSDADGRRYLDMNLADMSLFCGFAPPPVAEAIAQRVAKGGPVPGPH